MEAAMLSLTFNIWNQFVLDYQFFLPYHQATKQSSVNKVTGIEIIGIRNSLLSYMVAKHNVT